MNLHDKMVNILAKEDMKMEQRGNINHHRIALFLEALENAEKNPKGIALGIQESFEPPLLDKLQKALLEG
jgi:hypothetical protein